MKVLKATLCLLFAALIFLPSVPVTARADGDGEYAMAVSDSVYICKEPDDSTKMFAVPYTYYVEILEEYENWYLVRYAKHYDVYRPVIGYCKKDNLLTVDGKPQNEYLYYPLKVTLHPDAAYGNKLIPTLEISVTVAYYGNRFIDTAAYSYVLYGEDNYAYIEGMIDDYDKNPVPSDPAFSQNSSRADEGNVKFITMAIIAALAVTAIIVLLLTGNRKTLPLK